MNTEIKTPHLKRLQAFQQKAQNHMYKPDTYGPLELAPISYDTKVSLYLDYRNSFLTEAHFARHYSITESQARSLLDEMRESLKTIEPHLGRSNGRTE